MRLLLLYQFSKIGFLIAPEGDRPQKNSANLPALAPGSSSAVIARRPRGRAGKKQNNGVFLKRRRESVKRKVVAGGAQRPRGRAKRPRRKTGSRPPQALLAEGAEIVLPSAFGAGRAIGRVKKEPPKGGYGLNFTQRRHGRRCEPPQGGCKSIGWWFWPGYNNR